MRPNFGFLKTHKDILKTGMPSFTLSKEESIVFNIAPNTNCEDHLVVTNTSDSHLIFSTRTNSKVQFVVKPVKFYLAPRDSIDIRFTLRKNVIEMLDLENLPEKEKIEFSCLSVSSVFAETISKDDCNVNEMIRKRFKSQNTDMFKSIDNPEDRISDDFSVSEIERKRLKVVYNELVQNTPEEESSPITPPEASEPEEPLVEEPVVEKPVVENKMSVYTFVIVLILWSVLMVYFGSYLSNHS